MDMPMNAVNSIETVANRLERNVSEPQKDDQWYDRNWLTVQEAASRLGVKSAQAVHGLIRRQAITAIKVTLDHRGHFEVWRVDPKSIDRYLKGK